VIQVDRHHDACFRCDAQRNEPNRHGDREVEAEKALSRRGSTTTLYCRDEAADARHLGNAFRLADES
jgi:hypothetical protein